jgi:lycopene cyclase CruP
MPNFLASIFCLLFVSYAFALSPSTTKLAKPPSITRRLLGDSNQNDSSVGGGAGAGDGLSMLQMAEKRWEMTRSSPPISLPTPFITKSTAPSPKSLDTFDVAILGSTLGLIYALKLQSMGSRVAVLERGKVKGRVQEWNIGTGEFNSLQSSLGLDLTSAIGSSFETNRVGFGDFECRVKGVLDLGVKPDVMTEILKAEFERLGGTCFEDTSVVGLVEHPDAVVMKGVEESGDVCKSKIVLDCTGNGSPIARDYRKDKPSGICVVVGTCASGYDADTNDFGDVIYTNGGINEKNLQYFWESFPVGKVKEGEVRMCKNRFPFMKQKVHHSD